MEDYVQYLATRKFLYYVNIYKLKHKPHSVEELQKLTERTIRYEETVFAIEKLPREYREMVDKDFEERLEAYESTAT